MNIVILSVLAFVLAGCLVVQWYLLRQSRCLARSLQKGISKERNATADILRLSKDVMILQDREKDFLPNFIKYTVRSLKASGGALLLCGEDQCFYGCAVSGRMPPMKDVSEEIEAQIIAHDKQHSEFIRGYKIGFSATDLEKNCNSGGFAFFSGKMPDWLSPRFGLEAKSCLMAPIRFRNQMYGCIIAVTGRDEARQLRENDGFFLLRLAQLAELSIEFIKDFKRRQDYETQLQRAREEGMAQVSSGIIHNIGNAVTVAQITIRNLQDLINLGSKDRPETIIQEEMLPNLVARLADGTLTEYLKNDKIGKQYFTMMQELLEQLQHNGKEAGKLLESLGNKLAHISEIIELQQRFVGELGTENMTQMPGLLESATKIFEESFNKRGVKIDLRLKSGLPEILVDGAIITQVFINIIKNAIEAIDTENRTGKNYCLTISTACEERAGKKFVVAEIKDNGPGIPEDVKNRMFEFGFTTNTKNFPPSRGIGLHFSLDAVSKYGGMIECESTNGNGATFKVLLPAGKNGQS